jgi:hypothetical protein
LPVTIVKAVQGSSKLFLRARISYLTSAVIGLKVISNPFVPTGRALSRGSPAITAAPDRIENATAQLVVQVKFMGR